MQRNCCNTSMTSPSTEAPKNLKQLVQLARRLGTADAAIIRADAITVEDQLAELCREPRCENYALSAGCPPHVAGPAAFRQRLKDFQWAMVIKFDVPADALFSEERSQIFQLLHETAAEIERCAARMGYTRARAYAGGACKKLFCRDHADCREMRKPGGCRNPHRARESMSGFGINVTRLMEAAGWSMKRAASGNAARTNEMATVCGLILIG